MRSCAWQSQVFRENPFWPKNRENVPKVGQKQGFFNLLENMVTNFYWIWSIIKIYIICCVPAQIPYLWKLLFLKYGPKCSQPIRLQGLINHISRTNQWNSLIFYMLTQIHINQKLIKKLAGRGGQRWMWSAWTQGSKLDCISRMTWMEWDDFLHAGANSGKLRVVSVIFRWMWSKSGVWPFSSWVPKIFWMSLWIELMQ